MRKRTRTRTYHTLQDSYSYWGDEEEEDKDLPYTIGFIQLGGRGGGRGLTFIQLLGEDEDEDEDEEEEDKDLQYTIGFIQLGGQG